MRSADARKHAAERWLELQNLEQMYSREAHGDLFFPVWLLPLRLVAIKELKHALGARGEGYGFAITKLAAMLDAHDNAFLLEGYALFKTLLKSVAEVKKEAPELREALQEAVLYNEPDDYGRVLRELVSYSQAVVTPEREAEVHELLSALETKALLRGYNTKSM